MLGVQGRPVRRAFMPVHVLKHIPNIRPTVSTIRNVLWVEELDQYSRSSGPMCRNISMVRRLQLVVLRA